MKLSQPKESKQVSGIHLSMQVSDESQSEQESKKNTSEVPSDQDTGPASASRILKEDIKIVQSLIEQCLKSFMNQYMVVQTLQNRDRIDPRFTTLVWQKLEEQNAEFFKNYYISLKLIDQINTFNSLLKQQYEMMKDHAHPKGQVTSEPANLMPITPCGGTTAFDAAYESEVSSSAGSQHPSAGASGHPRAKLRHLISIPRILGLTDLISDSTNLADLGPLGNYPGSPFLPYTPSPPASSSDEEYLETKENDHSTLR